MGDNHDAPLASLVPSSDEEDVSLHKDTENLDQLTPQLLNAQINSTAKEPYVPQKTAPQSTASTQTTLTLSSGT